MPIHPSRYPVAAPAAPASPLTSLALPPFLPRPAAAPVYLGMRSGEVRRGVVQGVLRPIFPTWTPADFRCDTTHRTAPHRTRAMLHALPPYAALPSSCVCMHAAGRLAPMPHAIHLWVTLPGLHTGSQTCCNNHGHTFMATRSWHTFMATRSGAWPHVQRCMPVAPRACCLWATGTCMLQTRQEQLACFS